MAPALPPPVLARLRRGVPVLALSADGAGNAHSTYSWAVACDRRTLNFVVDAGSVTGANLAHSGRGALQVVSSAGLNLLISGAARRLRERVAAIEPAPMELWQLALDALKDQAWPGVATSALAYRWPADRRAAMRRLERAVYAELRGIGGVESSGVPVRRTRRTAGTIG